MVANIALSVINISGYWFGFSRVTDMDDFSSLDRDISLNIQYPNLNLSLSNHCLFPPSLPVQLGSDLRRPGLHPHVAQQEQPVRHRELPLLPHHVAARHGDLDLHFFHLCIFVFFVFFTD